METVTPVDVVIKDSGWHEVSLEDGRTASTKSRQLSDAMFQRIGQEVEVELVEKTNGKFTNIYLNKVDGVAEDRPKRAARSEGSGFRNGGDPNRDKRISAQWALGRAVELYCADHPAVTGDTDFTKIVETAKTLLAEVGNLTK